MPRGPGLAALVLALLVLPALGSAQEPGSPSKPAARIPTQQNFNLGPAGSPVNVTVWVMRDTRTIVYTPNEANPLAVIWNTTFTAGALGIVYLRAQPADNRSYDLTATLSGPGDKVTIENGTVRRNITPPLRPTAEYPFQFNVAGAAPPGPVRLTLAVQLYANDTGTPEQLDARTITLDLTIIDPVPGFAVRKDLGDTTVFGWVSGGAALARGGSGCLGGANTFRSDEVPVGSVGIACLLAVTHRADKVQLNASLSVPAGVGTAAMPWTSQPFNATTGGLSAPVTSFPFTAQNISEGAQQVRIDFVLRSANGTELGRDSLVLPFHVTKALVIPSHGPNWLLQAPALLATVGAIGYMAQRQRRPRVQPRSQALRELRGPRRAAHEEPVSAEQAAEQAEQQREAVQEAAWDKKRKILEAKREDILKSIRLAEERKERGEITEHVLNGIKERKERQLEQVEREMEELR